jgi:hypothetical protein
MLQENRTYKAGDFSKTCPAKNGSSEALEAFRREPLSGKSDVWSLGAVLWDILHTYLGAEPRFTVRYGAVGELGKSSYLIDRRSSTLPMQEGV